jgi:hypothetical protein
LDEPKKEPEPDPNLPTAREENVVAAAYKLMSGDFGKHLSKHEDEISAVVKQEIATAAADLKDDILLELGERISRAVDSKLDTLKSEFAEIVMDLESRLNSSLTEHENDAEEGLQQLRDIIDSLPRPQVIVPTDAIRVEVPASIVNVPPEALAVNVTQQAASIVERAPRKVRKTIEYGPDGRPAAIVEEEL